MLRNNAKTQKIRPVKFFWYKASGIRHNTLYWIINIIEFVNENIELGDTCKRKYITQQSSWIADVTNNVIARLLLKIKSELHTFELRIEKLLAEIFLYLHCWIFYLLSVQRCDDEKWLFDDRQHSKNNLILCSTGQIFS